MPATTELHGVQKGRFGCTENSTQEDGKGTVMNKELNIFTLRMLRDQYEAEHLDTEVEALDAAIKELERPAGKLICIDDIPFFCFVNRICYAERTCVRPDIFCTVIKFLFFA